MSDELKQAIKMIALESGFKLKRQPNGSVDLNPYVYEFAQRLIDEYKEIGKK